MPVNNAKPLTQMPARKLQSPLLLTLFAELLTLEFGDANVTNEAPVRSIKDPLALLIVALLIAARVTKFRPVILMADPVSLLIRALLPAAWRIELRPFPVIEISEPSVLVIVVLPAAPCRIELMLPSWVMMLCPIDNALVLLMLASPANAIWLIRLTPPPVWEINEPFRLSMVVTAATWSIELKAPTWLITVGSLFVMSAVPLAPWLMRLMPPPVAPLV